MQIDCFPNAPKEWPRRTVHEAAGVNPPYPLDKRREYPFVEMASVAEDFGGITGFGVRRPESSGYARFRANDILFGKITPCAENGKVALARELPTDTALGSTEFIVLSPRDGNDPRFIYALVCSNPVLGRAISRMEGSTGRLRVTEDVFSKWLLVPLPPSQEQRAIADILGAVDDAIERTRKAIEKAGRAKRALMQKVLETVSGTPVKMGAFVAGICYGTSQASNDNGWGYPTLRIPNIIGGGIDTADLSCVDGSDRDADRFALRAGDLLMVRTNGNPDYVGRSAVFSPPDQRRWLYASYLIRVRFKEGIVSRFVDEFLKSERGHRELLRRVTTSAGNHNINTKSILSIPIPAPDVAKQAQIVRLADAAEAPVQALENHQRLLERLKRGLMQDLLTGRVRVNASGAGAGAAG